MKETKGALALCLLALFASGCAASMACRPGEPSVHCCIKNVISNPIAKQLADHNTLRGPYKPRDPRFVARAINKEAHCGYQRL